MLCIYVSENVNTILSKVAVKMEKLHGNMLLSSRPRPRLSQVNLKHAIEIETGSLIFKPMMLTAPITTNHEI